MANMTSADIEHRRGRLLGFVFVMLAGFASLSVVFTFLGPDFLTPLQLTPTAARGGVLVLTIAFIALVWEKERQFRLWGAISTQQQILLASFENRYRVVEALLQSGDRVNAPLDLDDVLEVILEAAVDLVGAEGGAIDFFEGGKGDLSLHYSKTTDMRFLDRTTSVAIPLMDGPTLLAWLHLMPTAGSDGFDKSTMEALERFLVQASTAVRKAQTLSQERAAHAYREAANIVKSRFLTTISHELRTPLTSVLGFAATLSQHWDRLTETEKRDFVEEVRTQGSRMAKLLEKLLESARTEIEDVVVHPVRHDVRRSIRKALVPFLANASARLEVHLPETELMAEVDPFVIDQAVSNLVDNALRFTAGKIFISALPGNRSVSITVLDEGPGIQGEKLKHVLDPLRWQDEEIKDGTGLGLHIVGTLVESHGGEIDVVTDEVGTRIGITMPARYKKVGKQTLSLSSSA